MKRILGVWRGGEWYGWQNTAIRKRGSKKISTTIYRVNGEQAPPLGPSLPLSEGEVCVRLCVHVCRRGKVVCPVSYACCLLRGLCLLCPLDRLSGAAGVPAEGSVPRAWGSPHPALPLLGHWPVRRLLRSRPTRGRTRTRFLLLPRSPLATPLPSS